MAKESFLLVSLKESKAKKLAQVISNESCRKILDYLAEKEATETELSKKLDIPISTVHYNLKHITDAGLVTVEEFHYSDKGREVNHYKLSNKYVIITPKSTFGLKEKLKSILPVALITIAAAGFIHIFSKTSFRIGAGLKTFAQEKAAEKAVIAAPEIDAVAAGIQSAPTPFPIAIWFLIGALSALVIYFLLNIRKR